MLCKLTVDLVANIFSCQFCKLNPNWKHYPLDACQPTLSADTLVKTKEACQSQWLWSQNQIWEQWSTQIQFDDHWQAPDQGLPDPQLCPTPHLPPSASDISVIFVNRTSIYPNHVWPGSISKVKPCQTQTKWWLAAWEEARGVSSSLPPPQPPPSLIYYGDGSHC